jgi:hypothetical protein
MRFIDQEGTMLEITEALKSENDLLKIVTAANASEFIGRLTQEEFHRFMSHKAVRFFYDADQIVGFGAWQGIDSEWTEIGPVFIIPEARNRGFAIRYARLVLAENAEKKLLAATKNPAVKKMLRNAKFRPVPVSALPINILFHFLKGLTLPRLISLLKKQTGESIEFFLGSANEHKPAKS